MSNPTPSDPAPTAAPAPSEPTSQQQQPATETTTTPEKKKIDESDPWFGHLHHLSEEQEKALNAFRAVCAEKGLYTPAVSAEEAASSGEKEEGETGAKEASHDDATLLRFLRARRFDVNGALEQFKTTEEWRAENRLDDLYANIDVNAYEESRQVYPQWTGHRDRRGIPVYVFVIKNLNSKNMAAYTSNASSNATSSTHKSSTVPPRLLRLFALYENMIRFVLPFCSSLPRPNPETPIVSTTNIVDISGVGLKQFWNLKGHMQDASVLATAHYPETLDKIYIIGAPAFFPTVWGWIKRWFDPVTTSKIFILSSSEVKSTLSTFMEPSSFPKQYGGELDWNWGDMPKLDEAATEATGGGLYVPKGEGSDEKEYVKGPVVWHGDKVEVLGSVDGKERRVEIKVPEKKESTVAAEGEKEAPTTEESKGDEKKENKPPATNERVVPVFTENEKVGDNPTATVEVTTESEQKPAAVAA
ncbi:hypothetical protein FQN54_005433 [Arachnomyces sp. PD_36]|nr:hypothetical protein FQN54_005433 [Arachnomyces sp. PD_36]